MLSPDLLIDGPQLITEGIESFRCLDPILKNVVIHVEKTSRDDNHNISVSWPADTTLDQTIAAINQVWSGQKTLIFVGPIDHPGIAGYEIEGPLTPQGLLQYHPSGFNWLRVETPLNDQMPDLYVPFGKKTDYAGIILNEPAILQWKHFLPVYQGTAANPNNETSVRRALLFTVLNIN